MRMWPGPNLVSLVAGLSIAAIVIWLLGGRQAFAIAADTVWRFVVTVGVFVRYGLEGVRRMWRGERGLGPELVRRAFEDLGPTYLKLGQLVASSQGLFPDRYCVEFQKTLDRVPPFAWELVEQQLIDELGPIDGVFSHVDRRAMASASIAQVHGARTSDGRDVVIKVQRPNIERRVSADVRILRLGASMLAQLPTGELANPVGIVDDFSATIIEELDFQREAANLDEFNTIMRKEGHTDVRAPVVDHTRTTRRILTMERFSGVRVDDVAAITKRAIDPEERLIVGLRAWFQCLILYGFFHGDVHAGNLMLLDDDSLGFLDFGIIGRFPTRTRFILTDYLISFATGDYGSMVKVLAEMGSVSAAVDTEQLRSDLERAYAPMLKLNFGEINYKQVLPDILRVAIKHKMRLPREFVLVTKQLLYFDRYAKLLAPNLNLFSDPRIVMALSQDVMRARMAETVTA